MPELWNMFSQIIHIPKENDKYGVINSQGETKLDFKYDSLTYRKDADFIEGNTLEKIDSDIINRNLEVKISGIISRSKCR